MPIDYRLKSPLDSEALNALYAVSWPNHTHFEFEPVFSRAVAYLLAYDQERLVGSVYVAWDGAQHAFLLEPTVHPDYRHQGIGKELVRRAANAARDAGNGGRQLHQPVDRWPLPERALGLLGDQCLAVRGGGFR